MPEPGPEEFSRALFKVTNLIGSADAPYIIFGAVAVGRLDQQYLDLWARQLGIEQELAYMLTGGKFDFG